MTSTSNRRASLLGDALTFAFGKRRRPSVRIPPEPTVLFPHVLDISAPAADEELEERQRLRDAAAQSIGLRPLPEDLPPEEPEVALEEEPVVVLPPFGASYAAIAPFASFSATVPKFYPTNRILALAKPWRQRHVVLSVPAGRVSHLHLFKSTHPSSDNREIERLQIDANSAVFIADDDPIFDLVHVVKVAGVDVGAHRRDWNPVDDASRTVWLLHLPSSAAAQQWITGIKAAIFEQRTHRAGLPPTPANGTGPEPRGDMDVMLSMRLAASPSSALASPSSPDLPKQPPTPTSPNGTYAASLAPSASERSVRSVATAPAAGNRSNSGPRQRPPSSSGAKGAGTAAVAALKGLFGSSRPRSASSASIVSMTSSFEAGSLARAETPPLGDSFAHMGNVLAGKVNGAGSAVSSRRSGSVSGNRQSNVLERRIIGNGDRERVASEADATPHSTPTQQHATLNSFIDADVVDHSKRRSLSYGLQPPPRAPMKRWPESAVEESEEDASARLDRPPLRMYTHPHSNGSTGTAGSFGVRSSSVASVHDETNINGHTHLSADRISERSVSTGRSRASSVGTGTMRSNSGRGRRWSTLPRRMEPPESPPPPTPPGSGRSIPHPYANTSGDRASVHSFGSTNAAGKTASSSAYNRGKRASAISAISVQSGYSATGTSVSGVSVGGTSGNMNNTSTGSLLVTTSGGTGRVRHSMPPPPRPEPTTALPPAPANSGRDPIASGSPNHRTSFRDSRSSSISFREPPPPLTGTASLPAANSSQTKTHSFRESMTQRAMRLSLIAPRPPPSDGLPPRPDETVSAPAPITHKLHRRSNSTSATSSPSGSIRNTLLGGKSKLELPSIPASPASPPPRGPLPPTPASGHNSIAAPARHTSLKLRHRLRILSAPPAPEPQTLPETVVRTRSRPTSADMPSQSGTNIASPVARQGAMTLASFLSISASTPTTPTTTVPAPLPLSPTIMSGWHGTPPPGTPIGEKIIQLDDASFLQMSQSSGSAASTPVIRSLPVPPTIAERESEYAEVASLLPPPRRGSRQISVQELEPRTPTPESAVPVPPRDLEAEGAGPGPGKLFSLSRHSSLTSLPLSGQASM